MRKIWGVARLRFVQLLTSVRLLFVMALALLYMLGLYRPLREFAAISQVSITPYPLIFVFNDQSAQLTLCALSLALFSNAPFRDEMHDLIVARSGRAALAAGHCLYIFMTAVFYVLVLFVMQVLICIPYFRFESDWGTMLRAIAIDTIPDSLWLRFSTNNWVMAQFKPATALLCACALEILCVFLLGLIVYLGNRLSKRPVGLWCSGALVVLDITISNIFPIIWNLYSPLGMARLGLHQNVSLAYGFRFFAITSGSAIVLLILIEKFAPKLAVMPFLRQKRRIAHERNG